MDFLPYFMYWMLGGDISSFFAICKNNTTGQKGICISIWDCREIAKGIMVGSCVSEDKSICCNIHRSNHINSDNDYLNSSVYLENINTAHSNKATAEFEERKNENLLFHTASTFLENENNNSLAPEASESIYSKLWKAFAPPVDYRKPVAIEKDHDLRRPVEIIPDLNLRRPVMPEESHDLRWPVLEEDSHDLRNPIYAHYPTEKLPTIISKDTYPKENSESSEIIDLADFHYHSLGQFSPEENPAYNKCLETFAKQNFNNSSEKENTNWNGNKTKQENMELLDTALNVCGIPESKTTTRLVGGTDSAYLQWPWMVSLRQRHQKKYYHKCGAALLNSRWVITAAHCVQWTPKCNIVLRLGSYNLRKNDETFAHVEKKIHTIIRHPRFNSVSYENDIAMLFLVSPVEFKPNIKPICLPKNVGNVEGRTAVVLGWGRVTERGILSGRLQELHLPVLSNKECERMYSKVGPKEEILDVFICAGNPEGGSDACDGDSGGLLSILDSNGRWALIGLVSWGKVCAAPNQPGVYTRITSYIPWIEGTVACHSKKLKSVA